MADEKNGGALAKAAEEQCQECGTGLIMGRCFRCAPSCARHDSWIGVLFGTDWLLLRGQKGVLTTLLGGKTLPPDVQEYLEGILGFIDAVQDAAALETDQFSIFGNTEE